MSAEAVALAVEGVDAGYGKGQVLFSVSLQVDRGEVACLMGRNGAGKTTLLRTIMGLLPPARGRIQALGTDVTGWPGHRINRLGVAWVPQDDSVFPGLTVAEHLALAAHDGEEAMERAAALFPILRQRAHQQAQTLSGGERKMLGIAQALVSEPELLLLDEPTEGVAPIVVGELIPVLSDSTSGRSVLLVEQNVDTALALGGRTYILENGRVVVSGELAELHESGELHRRLALGATGGER
jgi:branched-chain amino acid transport system ATP-binding protein